MNREGAPPSPIARARLRSARGLAEAVAKEGAVLLDMRGASGLRHGPRAGLRSTSASRPVRVVGGHAPSRRTSYRARGRRRGGRRRGRRAPGPGRPRPVAGYLEGGVAAWRPRAARSPPSRRSRSTSWRPAPRRAGLQVLDVRRPAEYAAATFRGHLTSPRPAGTGRCGLDPARPTAVICAGGYRSSAGVSLLARQGFRDCSTSSGDDGMDPGWPPSGAITRDHDLASARMERRETTCCFATSAFVSASSP